MGLSAATAAVTAASASTAVTIVVVVIIVVVVVSAGSEYGKKTDQLGAVVSKKRIKVVKIPIPVPVVVSTVTHKQFLQLFIAVDFPSALHHMLENVGMCQTVKLYFQCIRWWVPRPGFLLPQERKGFAPLRSGRKTEWRWPAVPADWRES